MANFQERVVGVMRLQSATFEEVEHDAGATAQAAIVVLVATIAPLLSWYGFGIRLFLGSVVAQLTAWVVSAFLLFLIGTRLLPGHFPAPTVGRIVRRGDGYRYAFEN